MNYEQRTMNYEKNKPKQTQTKPNKPKVKIGKMNVTSFITINYELRTMNDEKNKPKQTQFQRQRNVFVLSMERGVYRQSKVGLVVIRDWGVLFCM